MHWIFLTVAGAFEIGFTACLKMSNGFTRLWWSLAFAVSAGISFMFLNLAIETVPLGTAYAISTAIGAVGTAVVGIAAFGDPVTFWRIFFLAAIVAIVVGLKMVSKPEGAAAQ